MCLKGVADFKYDLPVQDYCFSKRTLVQWEMFYKYSERKSFTKTGFLYCVHVEKAFMDICTHV